VSAHGLIHGNRRTRELIEIGDEPRPVAIQIFGADPAVMAEAARIVADAGADLIDVNMGCPVPKICKTGAGAALLADPSEGAAVLAAMVGAVDVPVTAKMRRGLTPAEARPAEAARAFEAAGAAAITFHPRAAAEEYKGTADHAITAEVVEAVSVPVLASGDILDAAGAAEVVRTTGCDAVAIGRASLGNPWVFGAIAAGAPAARPPLGEILAEATGFAREIAALIGPDRATGYMRRFYPWYLAGHPVGKRAMGALQTAPTLEEALALLAEEARRVPAAA
jgi:nifR3 family TIM-barrel protein